MTDEKPDQPGVQRRATTILAAGIASLVLFPLSVFLAPITWVLAYRNRGLRNDPSARRRWTWGVVLAGLGVAALVLLVVAVPSSQTPTTDQAASQTSSTAATAAKPAAQVAPVTAATSAAPPATTAPTPTPPEATTTQTTTATVAPATTSTPPPPKTTRTTTPVAPKPPKRTAARPTPDPAVVAQRFFLSTDDDAIALGDAIGAQLDGQNKTATIERIRKRILNRVNKRLLSGGDTSIAANLLISAGAQARDAARNDDLPRLVDARQEVAAARGRLADELRG